MTRMETTGMASKEAAVRDWVRRKLGSLEHELRVARIAETLFRLTERFHGMGGAERRLLVLGALVHDVGRAVEDAGHERHGARMLTENTSLPLGEGERRRLAYLTRYHKGKVPEQGQDEILQVRDGGADAVINMRALLGLLRTADGLDGRATTVPPRLVISVRGREVVIRGYVHGSAELAAAELGRPKKLRLLQETLGIDVRVEWYSMDAVALVA